MIRSTAFRVQKSRLGMVTAQVALSMTFLMGVMALVLDGGLLLVERRHAQATADAAALAAAADLYAGTTGSALTVASDNLYTNDGTNSIVTVNVPPANYSGGPHAGTALPAGYAEVIVTWYQQRGFSGMFGSGAIPVSARAVARAKAGVSGASSLPGILLLGATGTTLSVGGNGNVNVTDPAGYTGTGGSIYVDSTSSNAVNQNGNHAMATAPTVYLAQSGSAPSGVTATSGSVTMNAPQLPDPLAYLPPPTAGGTGVVSLPNGITGSMTLNSNTIYIVGGNGINLSGQDTVTGSGVMLYLTGANAAINLAGQANVTLSPMTSGPYEGVTIFQDRSDSNAGSLAGNGVLNITGTIYTPAAALTLVGNGTTNNYGSQLIANSMSLQGNGTVNVAFDPNNTGGTVPNLGRTFGLVE